MADEQAHPALRVNVPAPLQSPDFPLSFYFSPLNKCPQKRTISATSRNGNAMLVGGGMSLERSPTELPSSPIPELFDFYARKYSIVVGEWMVHRTNCLDAYPNSATLTLCLEVKNLSGPQFYHL